MFDSLLCSNVCVISYKIILNRYFHQTSAFKGICEFFLNVVQHSLTVYKIILNRYFHQMSAFKGICVFFLNMIQKYIHGSYHVVIEVNLFSNLCCKPMHNKYFLIDFVHLYTFNVIRYFVCMSHRERNYLRNKTTRLGTAHAS